MGPGLVLGCVGLHAQRGAAALGSPPRAPDNVGPPLVVLAEHVEQEEVDVVVERLVVQEQLCEVAQVLAVALLLLAVHLPRHGAKAGQCCDSGNDRPFLPRAGRPQTLPPLLALSSCRSHLTARWHAWNAETAVQWLSAAGE